MSKPAGERTDVEAGEDVPEAGESPPNAEARGSRQRKYVVRCGAMRVLCVLESKREYGYATKVICRTSRGMEAGEVLCEATERATSFLEDPPRGSILRLMTDQDIRQSMDLRRSTTDDLAECQRQIDELGLEMQLVDVERIFGGERIIVYYLADQRVDFRQLVRQLSSALQLRVEMRQIGVRDEAKLLADYGDCGKPVCCNTHLSKMPPVSMKMAKLQKATLDPSKISGRCGRLKCCLRYEYDTYEEMRRELPPCGASIVTSNGRATVLQQEILSQQLLVQTEDNRRILIPVDEVMAIISRGTGKKASKKKKASTPKD